MKIKISKNKILFMVCILVLMEPGIFKNEQYVMVDAVYSILKLASFFAVFLSCIKQGAISVFSLSVIIYELLIFFSTVINGNSVEGIRTFAGPALAAMGICLVFDLFSNKLYEYMKLLRNTFLVYYIINAVSVICEYVSQGGTNQIDFVGDDISTFFLGIDNRFVFYFMPGIVCALIVSLQSAAKPDGIFWIIVLQSLLILYILWSVGAFLAMLMIAFFFVFIAKHIQGKIVNAWYLITFWIIINLLFLFIISKGYTTELVQLADFYFEKGANLNIRFRMWQRALKCVNNSPFIGIGVSKSQFGTLLYGYEHAHNLFMNILMRGGWITILAFLSMLFIATKPLMKIRNTYLGYSVAFCLFCCLFLSLADSYDDVYFYMILAISYHIGNMKIQFAIGASLEKENMESENKNPIFM